MVSIFLLNVLTTMIWLLYLSGTRPFAYTRTFNPVTSLNGKLPFIWCISQTTCDLRSVCGNADIVTTDWCIFIWGISKSIVQLFTKTLQNKQARYKTSETSSTLKVKYWKYSVIKLIMPVRSLMFTVQDWMRVYDTQSFYSIILHENFFVVYCKSQIIPLADQFLL